MKFRQSVLMLGSLVVLANSVVLPSLSVSAAAAGDPAQGLQVFRENCSMCHSPNPGRNGVGPTLFGIVGSKSAAVPGYDFSPALRALGVTWDEATLDRWISGPTVPGSNMLFAGIKDAPQRANLIAYLETLK